MINKESLIRAKIKATYPFRAKKVLEIAAEKNKIEMNDDAPGLLYKKVFATTKEQGEIKLENIGKVYENGFKAVHNFNLDIKQGEFISLLGPSGCGKTTILRMIAGLEMISEGQLSMAGVTLNSSLPKERNLAMVFQNYALYPYMSVYDNVAFGLKIAAFSNNYSVSLLDKAINVMNPNHTEIKFLKSQIWAAKNKNDSLLQELKIKIKKEKKVGHDIDLYHELKERYALLKQEQKQSFLNSAEDIQEKKLKVSDLKKPIQESAPEVKAIKSQILDLQKKNHSQLKEIKAEIIKEQKNGRDIEVITNLKGKYQVLQLEQKQAALDSAEEIKAKKSELLELKKSIKLTSLEDKKVRKAEYKELLEEYEESIVICKKSIRNRIDEFADLVGIRNYLKRKPAMLSGGQRQRVALVRAISKDAGLFLFDEPLSNLDAKLRATMRTEIRHLHDSLGSSSIFVTHDQIEAMTMSDRIALMNKGYIQQIGTPSELFNQPSNLFVADFIGNPNINLVEGKLIKPHVIQIGKSKINISKRGKAVEDKLAQFVGKKVIIGIRPQNVITDTNIIASNKENIFTLDVINLESIGHENILNLKSPIFGKLFKVMANRYTQPKPNSKIKVFIDPNTIQVFETETGQAISSIPNKETQAALEIWNNSADERIKNMVLADKESKKEQLSRKLAKDAYGIVNKKYGDKRKEQKDKAKNKEYKDQTLIDQITGNGGN